MLLAAQKGLEDMTKFLVQHGANEESKNMALIPASHFGHLSAVQLLLEFGANQNYSNKKGTTPLMRAAQEGRENVVKFLIKKGADACASNVSSGIVLPCQFLDMHSLTWRNLIERRNDCSDACCSAWTCEDRYYFDRIWIECE